MCVCIVHAWLSMCMSSHACVCMCVFARMYVCVCVCTCVCVCVCVCTCLCINVCVCVLHVCVYAWVGGCTGHGSIPTGHGNGGSRSRSEELWRNPLQHNHTQSRFARHSSEICALLLFVFCYWLLLLLLLQ